MTVKEQWYSLDVDRETIEDNSIEKIHMTLAIDRLGFYVQKSQTFAREYYTCKSSVIRVPGSQFELKLVFLGKVNMEIYWRRLSKAKLSEFMELEIETCNHEYRQKSKKTIKYSWVQANKWQKCDSVATPNYNAGLILTFKFAISLAARVNNAPSPTTLRELTQDFENLLSKSDSNYDVTIKSVEGEEFKVHKNILTARCKVLKAHFEHSTKESTTSIVETHWEAKVLREVLTFLYTGSSPGIKDEPGKILGAADFYQLDGLKSLCVETMIEMLTVENAIETLQVALLHSVDTLRDQTLQFIKDGHARLITETQDWFNASREIVKMIYEFLTADEKVSYNIVAEAYDECNSDEYIILEY